MINIPESELSIKKYGCHKCLTCEKYGYDDVYVTHLPTGLEGNAKRSIFGIEGSSDEDLEQIKSMLEDPLQLAIIDLSNQVEFMKNKPTVLNSGPEYHLNLLRKIKNRINDCGGELASFMGLSFQNDFDPDFIEVINCLNNAISAIRKIELRFYLPKKESSKDELEELISNREKKPENSLSVKNLIKWFKK